METTLDRDFWDGRYQRGETGWDLGAPSPALAHYFSDSRRDRNARILIPGAGNAYEADMLMEQGYTDVTVIDIAPSVTEKLQERFAREKRIRILCGDFFALNEHFDTVVEQTFFCALPPAMRADYAQKMAEILVPGGILTGLLFNRDFEGGPPFGGCEAEYRELFAPYFDIELMSPCTRSVPPRAGHELFIRLRRKEQPL